MTMIRLIKNTKFTVFLLFFGLSFIVASCTCEEDCAEFSNFKMCGTAPVAEGCSTDLNVIPQDATHLTVSVEIKHGEPEDRLTVKYFVEDGNSFTEFFSQTIALKDIDEDVDGSERKIRGSIGVPKKVDRLWPIGDYKVELELSQEKIPLNATRNFSVE